MQAAKQTGQYRAALACLLLLAGLLLTTVAPAQTDRASTAARLDAVRERIGELEKSIEAARNEAGTLQGQLSDIEKEIQANNNKLAELRTEVAEKDKRLQQLDKQRHDYEAKLGDAREALARQMRAAYKSGRRDYLKLLLNQQDPALMGRMLTYYDYYNRARSEQIRRVSHELEQLAEVARQLQREQAAMAELETSVEARLAELRGLEKARSQIIAHLNRQIEDESQELATLQEDQERLQTLLDELRQRAARPARADIDQLPAFAKLQGKLDWPVSGKILNSFGSSRRGTMNWQGVRLSTSNGEDIRAVSAGQVVFADWFRTLGLLIIIDHGDGYMSLYGHNQELLKTRGAWVEDGEVIALAGNSGGQERSALYFEIRHDGKPVDPTRWCRRHARR